MTTMTMTLPLADAPALPMPTRQQRRTAARALKLLTTGNPKTEKGAALGYLTAILHLAPADLSGRNLCPWASPACIAACLNTAGRGGIFKRGETSNAIQRARIARSQWFADDRPGFIAALLHEIAAHVRRAHRHGLRPCVRLNGTSDLPWERIAPEIFATFPDVVFYDYTKAPHRMREALPGNYSLTFSRSEVNGAEVLRLPADANVAVVFAKALPETWSGRPVIDGDRTDLRFLDARGVVVGLRAKGRAKRDTSGFVIR